MTLKKLLMVAYYFPPQGGAGVQRTLKFVKFLPEFGWLPVVITVHPRYATVVDPTLDAEIPDGVQVFRTSTLVLPKQLPWRLRKFVGRWLLVVDDQLGWSPHAISLGRKLIAEHRPDAIFSTSAPFTDHLVAMRLANQGRIPWVADFRDPWLGNISLRFPTALHASVNTKLESNIIMQASRVTVVNESMRLNLVNRFPGIAPDKFVSIPNGYDPNDFNGIENIEIDQEKFIISYTGSFYTGSITPDAFLFSLKHLLGQQVINPNRLRVFFVGNINMQVQHTITAMGLEEVVKVVGYLAHRKSIAYLLRSNLLLLISGNRPGSEMITTGKVYEYLAAKKPILALSSRGAARDLILQARAGIVVDPEDVPGIASQIEYFYRHWEKGINHIDSRQEVVDLYDRRLLTAQLARLLDSLIPDQP